MKTKVSINTANLDTDTRRLKAKLVEKEMEEVINSEIFKDIFLRKLYNRNYHEGELSPWRYETPEAIFKHIMEGAETLSPEIDYEFDIDIDDYYSFKSVIGYTYPNITTIFVNTKFFDARSSRLCGSNLLHEQGHKLGFSHDFFSTKRRQDSLCYLLNEIYEEAYEKVFSVNYSAVCVRPWYFLKLKRVCKKVEV